MSPIFFSWIVGLWCYLVRRGTSRWWCHLSTCWWWFNRRVLWVCIFWL